MVQAHPLGASAGFAAHYVATSGEADEMVLVDSEDEDNAGAAAHSMQQQAQAEGAQASTGSALRAPTLAPEASRRGGWGVGAFAAAGTLMLDQPPQRVPGAGQHGATDVDDVFGGDDSSTPGGQSTAHGMAGGFVSDAPGGFLDGAGLRQQGSGVGLEDVEQEDLEERDLLEEEDLEQGDEE
jgi:hypothetical protein